MRECPLKIIFVFVCLVMDKKIDIFQSQIIFVNDRRPAKLKGHWVYKPVETATLKYSNSRTRNKRVKKKNAFFSENRSEFVKKKISKFRPFEISIHPCE